MLIRALLAALAIALATPAGAGADATAVRDGATVIVTGTDAAESVTALKNGTSLVLLGDVAGGGGCLAGPPVDCAPGVTRVRMHLGGGDDSGAGRRLFVFCIFPCGPQPTTLDVPLELDGGGADNDFATLDAFDRVSGCENLDVSAALQADLDHDGFAAPADCDDADPATRPGVADAPDNGLDENCDGADATIADRDRDRVRAPADCDDANAAIRPGAAEAFGNTVDEDCDGSANPLQTIESTVQSAFQAARKTTRVRRLRVTQVRTGTTLRIECPSSRKRRACRRAVTTVSVRRDTKRLDLRKRLGLDKQRPRVKRRIVLWLRRPDSLSRRVTFTFRSRRTPRITERCAPPGVTRVSRCPTTDPD